MRKKKTENNVSYVRLSLQMLSIGHHKIAVNASSIRQVYAHATHRLSVGIVLYCIVFILA